MIFAAWLQAIGSLILLIVTSVYVSYTYRIIHSPHKTILKPIKIDVESNGLTISIQNIGPNIAYNVMLETVVYKINEKAREIIVERSDFEVKPNEEAEYLFSQYTTELKYPFIISWETVTGQKSISEWFYSNKYGKEKFEYKCILSKNKYKKLIKKLRKTI